MSADVRTETSYVAYCADCAWGAGPFEFEDDADARADVHDEENHS